MIVDLTTRETVLAAKFFEGHKDMSDGDFVVALAHLLAGVRAEGAAAGYIAATKEEKSE